MRFSRRCWRKQLRIPIAFIPVASMIFIWKTLRGWTIEQSGFELPGPASLCDAWDAGRDAGQHVFFLETTGNDCLTPRQACSVESAARTNPELIVTLYVDRPANGKRETAGAGPDHRADTWGNRRNCDVTRGLSRWLDNVRVVRVPLIDQLRGTFLWDHWYLAGHWNRSRTPHVHLSDAVRLALLLRTGGVYLDLDVVVLRPVHCLRNTAGYLQRIGNWIENGVLAFDAGHPLLRLYAKLAAKHFKPDFRESMGPPVLAMAFKLFCKIDTETRLDHGAPYWCRDGRPLQLQPPDAFYAIGHDESDAFFQPHFDVATLARLRRSYLAHVYFHARHRVPPTSLYGTLARQFCPSVYGQALAEDF